MPHTFSSIWWNSMWALLKWLALASRARLWDYQVWLVAAQHTTHTCGWAQFTYTMALGVYVYNSKHNYDECAVGVVR
jgi:hypothetical protein